jgi:ankyrin repeat protein
MTLLHHVSFDGNMDALKLMRNLPYFKEVVDLDNNEVGWTPALWAAARGEVEIVEELVKGGAQILKPRKDGVTTLHLAACTNDVHMLNYVLKTKSTSSIDMISDDVKTIQPNSLL